MDTVTWIEHTLRDALTPDHIEIIDDSAQHAGHAGARAGGGHYRVLLVSNLFDGKDLVSRQRLVYDALGDSMRSRIHALALRTMSPAEWAARSRQAG